MAEVTANSLPKQVRGNSAQSCAKTYLALARLLTQMKAIDDFVGSTSCFDHERVIAHRPVI
jgi:hypothetical protein